MNWFLFLILLTASERADSAVRVGSKAFTESYILAEIMAQVIEQVGEIGVERKFGLGGTGVVFQALQAREIDLYPEYTGTITEAILKDGKIKSVEQINERFRSQNLFVSRPLGFNNTYALAVRESLAQEKNLKSISDLARQAGIAAGFSHEFMRRPDGFLALSRHYRLKFKTVSSLENSLAYEAVAQGQIDVTDIYSTSAKVQSLRLAVLEDDQKFFPSYQAVILARDELKTKYPKTWAALQNLEGKINESEMIRLNSRAEIDSVSFSEIASQYLNKKDSKPTFASRSSRIWLRTQEHLMLVGVSVFFAVLIGLPLGVIATRFSWLGQVIILVSGLFQTVPSLALLCFLIPILGIGVLPALVALFFYSLLPIVVGVYSGILSLDSRLIESAKALGLSEFRKLWLIELPLASRSIVQGIKTSAIIAVGTATLAALIGAGGYGTPIVSGLALNNNMTILEGAIPAAVLAIVIHGLFLVIERVTIPKGLQ